MNRKPPDWLVYFGEFLSLWILGFLAIHFTPGQRYDGLALGVTMALWFVMFRGFWKRFSGGGVQNR
jgi:hypothetical protein